MREGWKRVKLGEIITLRRGLTYKKDDEVGFSEKIVLRSNNVDLSKHLFDYDELKYLRADFDIPIDKYIKQGELLMCMSNGSKAHLGKVALYEGQDNIYAFGGFMSAISHNELISSKFLYYALITSRFKDYINTLSAGANINNLKTKDIDAYSIEIPSLSEQERIVSLLDLEFAKIDAIKANAEKQLQDAKALFQSALKDYLTPKEGWEKDILGNCVEKISDGSHNPPKGVEFSEYQMISSKNVGDNCLQDLKSIRYLSKENFDLEHKRTKAQANDILLTIVGTIGRCTILKDSDLPITMQRSVAIMTPKANIISKFLMYYFVSIRGILEKEAQGAAQKGIYLNQLKKLLVTYPSLSEQQQIAEQLDKLSAKIKSLQFNFDTIVNYCNDLKQSILKDIFG